MPIYPYRLPALLACLCAVQIAFAQNVTGIEPSWSNIKANDPDAQVITQRADSPIYSRMATDEKFNRFAYNAFNSDGQKLRYTLILKSRSDLFAEPDLRKVYSTKTGPYYVSYWVKEVPSKPEQPYSRNTAYLLVVVDTVPADRSNVDFNAVAGGLPFAVSRILLTDSPYKAKWEDWVGAVKWDCTTSEGKSVPTMVQPVIVMKPNFAAEVEMYGAGFFVAENGELRTHKAGKNNICTKRSVGDAERVSKWARFFGWTF